MLLKSLNYFHMIPCSLVNVLTALLQTLGIVIIVVLLFCLQSVEGNFSFFQMLLQKLKGPPYSPLDITIFPQSESRMKNSRSGVDSGIGESVLVSSGTRTVNSDRLQTPSSKTFSPAFFSLVQLCLQQDPEKRYYGSLLNNIKHVFYVLQKLCDSFFPPNSNLLIKKLQSNPDNINAKNKQRL